MKVRKKKPAVGGEKIPAGVELVETLRGLKVAINGMAWSPDGKVLAAGSGDGRIGLWGIQKEKMR